jgi:hypothetical protein
MSQENISNQADSNLQKNSSILEKYNCTEFYFKTSDCVKKYPNDPKICEELLEKLGECVYLGMIREEKHKI